MDIKRGKKWSSFEEMYIDLKEHSSSFKDEQKKSIADELFRIIKMVEDSQDSRDFFNCTCRLSSLFDSLDKNTINEIYKETNIYVLVLNAVLRNNLLIQNIKEIFVCHKKINELKTDKVFLEKLILLNTALNLAFFGISLNHDFINKKSIEFLRRNILDLMKNILREISSTEINISSLCFVLEKITWDNGLYFNQNYDSKFPVKLKDDFLFTTLRTSRSFAGITFVSLSIRPSIEKCFKKRIKQMNSEYRSISKELDAIYNLSMELNESIEHYYRNTPKNITEYFNIFIQKNERNIIFLLNKVCKGFHFQENKKFFEIILQKINDAAILKKELSEYSKNNFSAFNKNIQEEDFEWTNKLFIISIKMLSAFEEVKDAHDKKWVMNVGLYELNQWIIEVNDILNKYYTEDDWDNIKKYTAQENEIVEWKSSFFTPLEQEYIDDMIESSLNDKLFGKIIKVILAMLNTEGGTLIVGIIENFENIKRKELLPHIITKNNTTFFDINFELKKHGKTLDHIRLQILENLKKITDCTTEEFNGLIDIDPIILRNNEKTISVIMISIKKSHKQFFNIKKEGDMVWLSLTKRAQGQNVNVDIRKYI